MHTASGLDAMELVSDRAKHVRSVARFGRLTILKSRRGKVSDLVSLLYPEQTCMIANRVPF